MSTIFEASYTELKMAEAEIARLRKLYAELLKHDGDAESFCNSYATENERFYDEIVQLRAALKPFASAAEDAEGYADDHALACLGYDPQMLAIKIENGAFAPLKVLHLREARRAIGPKHPSPRDDFSEGNDSFGAAEQLAGDPPEK